MSRDTRHLSAGWLALPAILATAGVIFWSKSGAEFFDTAAPAWLRVSAAASVSALLLLASLRLQKVQPVKARIAALFAWSFWMLGLPGLAYFGLVIFLPLELFLCSLVVDFLSKLGMWKTLSVVGATRCLVLIALAYS